MRGWRYESWRHSLARKGIKTKKLHGKIYTKTRHDIPITVNKPEAGKKYPITPEQVKKKMDYLPECEVKGLKEVVFKNPDAPGQEKAWAQFTRSDGKINIFSQPVEAGTIDGEPVEEVNKKMEDYVVPHEVSHNYMWNVVKHRDDPEEVEEAKADLKTFGKDYNNKKLIREQIERRRNGYT